MQRLRERFAGEGLKIVLPVSPTELPHEAAPLGRAGILVADGGGEFFGRFLAAGGPSHSDPLDAYTRRRVRAVVEEVIGPREAAFEIFHPFADEKVHLPFQRLGQAAGLPPPGPLGVQVHPTYGPWWAYRALVVLSVPLAGPPSTLAESCADCRGPCVNDCSEHAVEGGRWEAGVLRGPIVCGDACGARLRCPVGAAARYPAEQIAFHARARRATLAARGA